MAVTPAGQPRTASQLDLYESPGQTLTHYLSADSDLRRTKTVRASPEEGAPLTRVSRRPTSRFHNLRGYKVERPQLIYGPSHLRIQHLRSSEGDPGTLIRRQQVFRAAIVARNPSFQKPGFGIPRIEEEDEPLHQIEPLPHTIRRLSIRRAEQIVIPTFERLMLSSGGGNDEQLWATAQEIIEQQANESGPVSQDECLYSQLQRCVSNKSPDSTISGVQTAQMECQERKAPLEKDSESSQPCSKLEEEHADADLFQTEEPRLGRWFVGEGYRYSTLTRSESSGVRRGRPLRRSGYEPRREEIVREKDPSNAAYQRWFKREVDRELENGGRFKYILERQEDLRDEVLEGHLDKILGSLKHRSGPETISELEYEDVVTRERTKWIDQEVPIRTHDVCALRWVSSIRWTPETEPTMSNGYSALVEEAGDGIQEEHVKRKWRDVERNCQGFKRRLNKRPKTEREKWYHKLGKRLDTLVSPSWLWESNPTACQERRLRGWTWPGGRKC